MAPSIPITLKDLHPYTAMSVEYLQQRLIEAGFEPVPMDLKQIDMLPKSYGKYLWVIPFTPEDIDKQLSAHICIRKRSGSGPNWIDYEFSGVGTNNKGKERIFSTIGRYEPREIKKDGEPSILGLVLTWRSRNKSPENLPLYDDRKPDNKVIEYDPRKVLRVGQLEDSG